MRYSLDSEQFRPFYNKSPNGKRALRKQSSSLDFAEAHLEKDNQWIANFSKNHKESPVKRVLKIKEDKHVGGQVDCFVHFQNFFHEAL